MVALGVEPKSFAQSCIPSRFVRNRNTKLHSFIHSFICAALGIKLRAITLNCIPSAPLLFEAGSHQVTKFPG